MIDLQIWWRLTEFGDSAVLLPLALAVALWMLITPRTRRCGRWWLAAVLVDAGLVALSKILYMGWGLHPPGLVFTGVSGDAAMAFLFWPAAGVYLAGPSRPRLRWLGACIGVALALIVAVSRVALNAHSVSESVLGSLCGLLIVTAFLRITWSRIPPLRVNGVSMLIAALLLAILVAARHYDFNRALGGMARQLSGQSAVTHVHKRLTSPLV